MIKRWISKLFSKPDSSRIIYFSETKDIHLIGKEISLFTKSYIITEIIRISWLRKRGQNYKYVPLYAVRGIENKNLETNSLNEKTSKG